MSNVAPPVPLTLVNALYHAGIIHPRMKPELDCSPYAFLGNAFWLRFGHFETPPPGHPYYRIGATIAPKLDLPPVNALPDETVTAGGIILPEGLR